MRAIVAWLPLLAGCFFGHDHDHGHGGHGHGREHEELPSPITAENAKSAFETSLRRVNGAALADGAALLPWREEIQGRPVVVGLERRGARIEFRKIRKVEVTPPAQGGLKLWEIAFHADVATPLTLVSADGEAVKALAASVELLRNPKR